MFTNISTEMAVVKEYFLPIISYRCVIFLVYKNSIKNVIAIIMYGTVNLLEYSKLNYFKCF